MVFLLFNSIWMLLLVAVDCVRHLRVRWKPVILACLCVSIYYYSFEQQQQQMEKQPPKGTKNPFEIRIISFGHCVYVCVCSQLRWVSSESEIKSAAINAVSVTTISVMECWRILTNLPDNVVTCCYCLIAFHVVTRTWAREFLSMMEWLLLPNDLTTRRAISVKLLDFVRSFFLFISSSCYKIFIL